MILKEAGLVAKRPIEYLPSCRKAREVALPSSGILSEIAKAQANAGLNGDAAATFEKTLQFIPVIEDNPAVKADSSGMLGFPKPDVAKIQAPPAIAVAQNEADFHAPSAGASRRSQQVLA